MTLVTVIVTCYNHEKYVLEALESVRQQTFSDFQLIIVDDCSRDQSATLIQEWIDEHKIEALFLRHIENRGLCASLNEALSHAKGTYIAYFSADDVMREGRLEHQVALFESSHENVGVVYSNAYQIDGEGRALQKTFFETYRSFETPPEGDVLLTLMEGNFIPAPSAMIRKECFEKVGGYDERLTLEDWDMWLRIATSFHFKYCPYVCIKYRQHSANFNKVLESSAAKSLVNTFLSFESLLKFPLSGRSRSIAKQYLIYSAALLTKLHFKERGSYLRKAFFKTGSVQILGFLILHMLPTPVEKRIVEYLFHMRREWKHEIKLSLPSLEKKEKKLNYTVHPYSVVQTTTIGEGTQIGPFVHILPEVVIGKRVTIQSGAYIGQGCVIKDNATIGPNATLYPGTVIEAGDVMNPTS